MRPSTVVLKPDRAKPVVQGHPWLFSGAIQRIDREAVDGEFVTVVEPTGRFLATGYLNRRSQIQVRLLSWQPDEEIDEVFWRRRLAAAIGLRGSLPGLEETTAFRLVNAESDYLPGLTVDRYGDFLVLQAGTLAIDRRKELLATLLLELTGAHGVVERSEMSTRKLEGLGPATGVLAGAAPPAPLVVFEHGAQFYVDLLHGQKTGFYADQRVNRQAVARYCAGKTVLNAFSYTGAFAVAALRAGARHVVNVDSSVDALTQAEENLRANGLDPDRQGEQIAGDVFAVLHDWQSATADHRYEVAILDPPKFAHSQQGLERALRGYKEINRLALRLLEPGGILATFSCSGLVDASLFQKVVFGAALDAGRQVQILEWLRQSPDHPVAVTFPEGEYLKGLICRVL
jgi:23S rRNA (cytosine1962-C5)-methyltransferase